LPLGVALREIGYRLVTPTPETHRRVNARPENAEANTLRDALGWSRPFRPGVVAPELLARLEVARALEPAGPGLLRARIRCSTAGDALFVHSAYPTLEPDAVFFGPDTYRFLALLRRAVSSARRAVDVGCGTGAGGLSLLGRVGEVVLADVSPRALRLARVNAAIAGARVELALSDVLAGVSGPFDLVVANPPYLADPRGRTYRDGGEPLGTGLSVRIAREALERLEPGGRLVLYGATPVVEGRHVLEEALRPVLEGADDVLYEELDPDVFGEELEREPYTAVERIAVVAVTCRRPGGGADPRR
jgi:SAM-dependent methyltransferase